MLGRFFYGQCSLSEAFWKFSILGLTTVGYLTRLFRGLLMQSVNYNKNFLSVAISSFSFVHDNPTTLPYFCCYVALFLTLIAYSAICVIGMWKTYKSYEKSKLLAFICFALVVGLVYFFVNTSIY